jgi:hypothetical protein
MGRAGNRYSIVLEPVKPRGLTAKCPIAMRQSRPRMTAIPAEIMLIKKTGLCKHFDDHSGASYFAHVVMEKVLAARSRLVSRRYSDFIAARSELVVQVCWKRQISAIRGLCEKKHNFAVSR